MMGLPYGEEIMIVGRTMWTQSTSVTDRQTDRQTDRIMITDTVQRIALHGKNTSHCAMQMIISHNGNDADSPDTAYTRQRTQLWPQKNDQQSPHT